MLAKKKKSSVPSFIDVLFTRRCSPMTIPLNNNNNKPSNASSLLATSLPSTDIAWYHSAIDSLNLYLRSSFMILIFGSKIYLGVLESMAKKEVSYAISYESDVDTGHN